MSDKIHQKNLPTPLLFEVSFCKINIFLRKRIVFQNFSYLCSDFLKHKAYELSSYTLSITADLKLQPIVNTWIYIRRNTDETYYIPNYIISICHDDYSDMVRKNCTSYDIWAHLMLLLLPIFINRVWHNTIIIDYISFTIDIFILFYLHKSKFRVKITPYGEEFLKP